MRVYEDSSWWIALKNQKDSFHTQACKMYEKTEQGEFLWTSWNEIEVFNCFRQMEYRKMITSGDALKVERLIEQEITLGYWISVEVPWGRSAQRANRISTQFGRNLSMRGMDLFHIAIAVELGVDWFYTFDQDQEKLARKVGFSALSKRLSG